MKENEQFRKDIADLKLSPSDFGFLVGRSQRCINYYCQGLRSIPTYIYVKLSEFQKMDKIKLWKKLPEKWRSRK